MVFIRNNKWNSKLKPTWFVPLKSNKLWKDSNLKWSQAKVICLLDKLISRDFQLEIKLAANSEHKLVHLYLLKISISKGMDKSTKCISNILQVLNLRCQCFLNHFRRAKLCISHSKWYQHLLCCHQWLTQHWPPSYHQIKWLLCRHKLLWFKCNSWVK